MTYWNLVLRRGVERFAADLAADGGAGLITPDLIPEEADEWIAASDEHGLDRVFLVAPSSTPERLAKVTARHAAASSTPRRRWASPAPAPASTADARDLVERTRAVTDLPVCVGLGVSTGAQAAELAAYADGVIVGSALVRTLTGAGELGDRLDALRALTAELADGVRTGADEHARWTARPRSSPTPSSRPPGASACSTSSASSRGSSSASC